MRENGYEKTILGLGCDRTSFECCGAGQLCKRTTTSENMDGTAGVSHTKVLAC